MLTDMRNRLGTTWARNADSQAPVYKGGLRVLDRHILLALWVRLQVKEAEWAPLKCRVQSFGHPDHQAAQPQAPQAAHRAFPLYLLCLGFGSPYPSRQRLSCSSQKLSRSGPSSSGKDCGTERGDPGGRLRQG